MRKTNLLQVYNKLSITQRNNFWLAATNVFLVAFTFWLGITIQFIVVDQNSKYNNKLTRLEYYSKMSDVYTSTIAAQNAYYHSNVYKFVSNIDMESIEEADVPGILDSLFNKEYLRDMVLYADSIMYNASKIQFVITDSKIYENFSDAFLAIFISSQQLKIFLEYPGISFREQWRKALSDEDFYKTINIPLSPNHINRLIKGFSDKQLDEGEIRNVLFNAFRMLSGNINNMIEIIDSEINQFSNKTYLRQWEAIPVWLKSIIILLIMLVVAYYFTSFFLSRMYLPSKEKMYSKEEYKNMETDLYSKKAELINLVNLNQEIEEKLKKQQEELRLKEIKLIRMENKYTDLLAEIRKMKEDKDNLNA